MNSVLQGNRYPPFTKKASSKRDRLLIAFSFLLLFFPSSDPKLNPLLCPFSGEEVAHESSFFSFFFISGPRSVVERKGVVGNYDHDGFAFDGYRWTRNFQSIVLICR